MLRDIHKFREKERLGGSGMPPRVGRVMTLLLAGMVLVAFVLLSGRAISHVWSNESCSQQISSFPAQNGTALSTTPNVAPPPLPRDTNAGTAIDYVATLIAALVGGTVAIAFGIQPRVLFSADPRGWMITAYGLGYFAVGAVALCTWMLHEPCAGTYLKNVGTTFFGMALAIVGAYLQGAALIRGK